MDRVAVSAAVRECASKIDMQDKPVEAVCAFVEGKDTLLYLQDMESH